MSETISVPDIGEASDVEVIEILVQPGDHVAKDDSIIVLESDKASMEIPSPVAGVIQSIEVKLGDKVDEGDTIALLVADASEDAVRQEDAAPVLSVREGEQRDIEAMEAVHPTKPGPTSEADAVEPSAPDDQEGPADLDIHAGPAVRKQARDHGVDLSEVSGTGRRGRIVREDVVQYVKMQLTQRQPSEAYKPVEVDFSKYGEVESVALSRIRQTSALNLHRSWTTIPHVTHFEEADVTELESFRKERNGRPDSDVRYSPLAFVVLAAVRALKKFPPFNSSLDPSGSSLILKKYYNIGIAVDTDDGLVVPVLRHADEMGLEEISRACALLAAGARAKKLPLDAMQGSTFTISSLGGIGGTAFTPIINAPEVAVLGVSRSRVQPIYDGAEFGPRDILPLSLSYDHRVVDGAEAARFCVYLANLLGDIRLMLL
jgi:pyruvate dehydrogenase E2 component (dihydrolipoamide acetyltransferase)